MLAATSSQIYDIFPQTKYMGSKFKLLPILNDVFEGIKFKTALDAFSGTSSVSYLLKSLPRGVKVTSNDYLQFCYHIANSVIANDHEVLKKDELESLIGGCPYNKKFIQRNFGGLYYDKEDLEFLDNIRFNIDAYLTKKTFKYSLALAALARACIKRRPRGIFAYTGFRYDDGRRDFRRTLEDHFRNCVEEFNSAVFSNGQKNSAICGDIFALEEDNFDLVYIDSPYHTSFADNDYPRRYHFVEGLMSYWEDVKIDYTTKTRKFPFLKTIFDSKATVEKAFQKLFNQFAGSTLVVSYSSKSYPTKDDMRYLLGQAGKKCEVVESDYQYSFATQRKCIENNNVKEYIFIAE